MYQNNLCLLFCVKPLATNLALKVCNDPSELYFFRNTHLLPIGFDPLGKSTKTHVLLNIIESISSFTASFQKAASLEAIASLKVLGSSLMFNNSGVFLITLSLLPSTKKVIESGDKKSGSKCFSIMIL